MTEAVKRLRREERMPDDLERVSYDQHVRLYVEAELGIPPEESSVPPSAERDKLRAEAARWVKNAQAHGL